MMTVVVVVVVVVVVTEVAGVDRKGDWWRWIPGVSHLSPGVHLAISPLIPASLQVWSYPSVFAVLSVLAT